MQRATGRTISHNRAPGWSPISCRYPSSNQGPAICIGVTYQVTLPVSSWAARFCDRHSRAALWPRGTVAEHCRRDRTATRRGRSQWHPAPTAGGWRSRSGWERGRRSAWLRMDDLEGMAAITAPPRRIRVGGLPPEGLDAGAIPQSCQQCVRSAQPRPRAASQYLQNPWHSSIPTLDHAAEQVRKLPS